MPVQPHIGLMPGLCALSCLALVPLMCTVKFFWSRKRCQVVWCLLDSIVLQVLLKFQTSYMLFIEPCSTFTNIIHASHVGMPFHGTAPLQGQICSSCVHKYAPSEILCMTACHSSCFPSLQEDPGPRNTVKLMHRHFRWHTWHFMCHMKCFCKWLQMS